MQITEDELESLEAETNRSIDLKEFVPLVQSILSTVKTVIISER